jgi:large subunit ribosomal protein L25
MSEYKLAAEPRSETGKGAARRARVTGRVPAVLYGHGMDPQHLSVDAREFTFALRTDAGANVLLELAVGRRKHLALAKDIQRDPLRGAFIHVDFLAVRRGEQVNVQVPVQLTGEAPGIREGGRLEQFLYQVNVEAEVTAVPEFVEADISALAMGDMLRVSDLRVSDGVTITDAPDTPLLTVASPAAAEEPAAEEAAAEEGAPAAEPEGGEAAEGGE